MFEDKGLWLFVARGRKPALDAGLRVLVDVECNVVKRRERHLRPELRLILGIRELEEGERATVREAEKQVAVDTLGAEQHVLLTPSREQWQPDDVLIELARRL